MRRVAALQPVWTAALADELPALKVKDARTQKRLLATRLHLHPAASGINGLEKKWRQPLTALLAMVGTAVDYRLCKPGQFIDCKSCGTWARDCAAARGGSRAMARDSAIAGGKSGVGCGRRRCWDRAILCDGAGSDCGAPKVLRRERPDGLTGSGGACVQRRIGCSHNVPIRSAAGAAGWAGGCDAGAEGPGPGQFR